MQRFTTNTRGFSLIELLVVMFIIIILSVIGLQSYVVYGVKQRDSQRKLDMGNLALKLDQFRNDKGSYPCGDDCSLAHTDLTYTVPSGWYNIDCSGSQYYTPTGSWAGNDPDLEVNGFLNGGRCCQSTGSNPTQEGYPMATTTTGINYYYDDSAWGLYRFGYSKLRNPQDPLNADVNGRNYYYCYASPAKGRGSYALFMRLENDKADVNDGGLLPSVTNPNTKYYEYYSPGYPKDGWNPRKDGPGGIWSY